MNSFMDWARNKVQTEMTLTFPKTEQAFGEVIIKPPPPSPQELFNQFMQTPAPERQQMAQQMGTDAYNAHVQEMLTIGEGLMGSQVWDMEPYFAQDTAMVPGSLENVTDLAYGSLIDQALAESQDGESLYPTV